MTIVPPVYVSNCDCRISGKLYVAGYAIPVSTGAPPRNKCSISCAFRVRCSNSSRIHKHHNVESKGAANLTFSTPYDGLYLDRAILADGRFIPGGDRYRGSKANGIVTRRAMPSSTCQRPSGRGSLEECSVELTERSARL
jgi:hypothetical protein